MADFLDEALLFKSKGKRRLGKNKGTRPSVGYRNTDLRGVNDAIPMLLKWLAF